MIGPLVAQDGPAIVVAPYAIDQQVARRKAFLAETQSADERAGGEVGRLNIRFQAMKPKFLESLVEDQRQTFRHIALSFESSEGIEPQVGTLENSHDGFAHVDHAGQEPVGLAPDQESDRPSRTNTLQVGLVLLVATRRKNPRPMQAFASPRGLENLALAIHTGFDRKTRRSGQESMRSLGESCLLIVLQAQQLESFQTL